MDHHFFRRVENLPLLLSALDEPIGYLRNIKDIEVERVLHEEDLLHFSIVNAVNQIYVEQEILYRGNRYVVRKVEETRQSDGYLYTFVECLSAFVELNDRSKIGTIEFVNLATQNGINRILDGTGWTVGYVEPAAEEYLHSMKETDRTSLWLLRQFARITGYEIVFDSLNRVVHFVHETGRQTDEVIRYRKNLKEIRKTMEPPQATVLYPRGRGGLSIESVNGGIDFIEDYSWYTEELGLSLPEAKKRFRKDYVWEDNRFVYAGNLLREGQKQIKRLSRPQIAYETSVMYIGTNELDVGDYAYVIDDELGLRLSIRVVRILDRPGREWENEIEFNYLLPGLGGSQVADGRADAEGKEETVIVQNESAITIGTSYQNLIEMSFTAYASTNLSAGVHLIGKASEKTVLTAYFTFRGQRIGPEIKQTVEGWQTIGVPFSLLQIQDGSGFLLLYVKVDAGTFTIERNAAELYVKGLNLLGGAASGMPKGFVVEEVSFDQALAHFIVEDQNGQEFDGPLYPGHIIEQVVFDTPFVVTDNHLIEQEEK